jgi:hypothetical protein
LYTNEVGENALVPFWLQREVSLSAAICFVCVRSLSFRIREIQSPPTTVSFWKIKISDVKNCFFRFCTMFDVVVPLSKAFISIPFFAVREYPVKK